MRLKKGVLEKLSQITRLNKSDLSKYINAYRRPGRKRALLLEAASKKLGLTVPAEQWLYGTKEQIKNEFIHVNVSNFRADVDTDGNP